MTALRSSTIVCDVGALAPDAVTVDALARLQLAARRNGCQVRLRNASAELVQLVDFMGLRDVLFVRPMSFGSPHRRLPGVFANRC